MSKRKHNKSSHIQKEIAVINDGSDQQSIEDIVEQSLNNAGNETPVVSEVVQDIATAEEQIEIDVTGNITSTDTTLITEEITPVVVTPKQEVTIDEEVVEVTPTVTKSEANISSDVDFLTNIAIMRDTGTAMQQYVINYLDKYAEEMAPGKVINSDAGAKKQLGLSKLLTKVLNETDPSEFSKVWNIIIGYFKNNPVFKERYVFRFSESWAWNTDILTGFQRLLNLLITSSDNSKNNVLKLVNIDKTLEVGFTDIARQRLISYYK